MSQQKVWQYFSSQSIAKNIAALLSMLLIILTKSSLHLVGGLFSGGSGRAGCFIYFVDYYQRIKLLWKGCGQARFYGGANLALAPQECNYPPKDPKGFWGAKL